MPRFGDSISACWDFCTFSDYKKSSCLRHTGEELLQAQTLTLFPQCCVSQDVLCNWLDEFTLCLHLDVSVVECYLMTGCSDWLAAVCQSQLITDSEAFNRHLFAFLFLKQPACFALGSDHHNTAEKKEVTVLYFPATSNNTYRTYFVIFK